MSEIVDDLPGPDKGQAARAAATTSAAKAVDKADSVQAADEKVESNARIAELTGQDVPSEADRPVEKLSAKDRMFAFWKRAVKSAGLPTLLIIAAYFFVAWTNSVVGLKAVEYDSFIQTVEDRTTEVGDHFGKFRTISRGLEILLSNSSNGQRLDATDRIALTAGLSPVSADLINHLEVTRARIAFEIETVGVLRWRSDEVEAAKSRVMRAIKNIQDQLSKIESCAIDPTAQERADPVCLEGASSKAISQKFLEALSALAELRQIKPSVLAIVNF